MENGWIVQLNGDKICLIKSRKMCVLIIVSVLFLILAPILILLVTYGVAPCFYFGLKGKFYVFLFSILASSVI